MDTRQAAVAAFAGVVLLAGAAGCGADGSAPPSGAAPVGTRSVPPAPSGANGVDRLEPREIVDRSVQALKDGYSARAAGWISDAEQEIAIDLVLDTDADCTGVLSLGEAGSLQLVKSGATLWVKPDALFWAARGTSDLARQVGDRYLRTTETDPDFADVAALCDLVQFADSIGREGGTLSRGDRETVGGTPAIAVESSGTEDPGRLYVATEGRPYPLRLEKTGAELGRIDFTEFGVPVPTAVPSPEESVDLDQLRQGPGGAESPQPV
ncbi:hypothetical protein [Kitasatospora camelliae]|uniref:Lipoprotein LprG n=1 Tax=Kitasatospora camelliae TaxID=3156397 RepID=A0AAU8K5M9_9ACTN